MKRAKGPKVRRGTPPPPPLDLNLVRQEKWTRYLEKCLGTITPRDEARLVKLIGEFRTWAFEPEYKPHPRFGEFLAHMRDLTFKKGARLVVK